MKRPFAAILLLLAVAVLAQAHFVFVVPQPGSTKASVFISETLSPADEVDLSIISGAKLSLRDASGRDVPLELVKASHAFEVALSAKSGFVHGVVDLGTSKNGSNKPYLLLYHPKSILGDAFTAKTVGETPVEIVPTGKPGAMMLKLLANGKPHPNAEITVILPDGSQQKMKTNENGLTTALTQTGRYGAWARFWEPGSGDRKGVQYDQVRHYATIVFDASQKLPPMPEATSSFGSVVSGEWLYVYGGHVSPTHEYFNKAVSGKFHRWNTAKGGEWEELPSGPALQGLNLAAHNGKIYRIGGMTPLNNKGEKTNNHSTAECARFDPATKKWEAITPLPQPRSSHDVVVIGDLLIVTGGWNLDGGRTDWADTLVMMDLSASKPEWKTAKQPFNRRALMAAAYKNKLYVVGGFDEKNNIVRKVSVYDPKSNEWSEAPELPSGAGLAFAPAAGVHDDALYVSVSDGTLLKLEDSAQKWTKVGSATPRLAHRIASSKGSVLVLGGAAKGANFDLMEAVPVASK